MLTTFSPRELLVQWRLDYKKHCWVLPGTYCKVHDKPVPLNTMSSCTHECNACSPTENFQGRVKFYCLNTGRILKQISFTEIPMPTTIIDQVNQIGAQEKQGQDFCFNNRSKQPYKWTDVVPEDDPEFQGLLEDKEAISLDINAELPGVELEEDKDTSVVVMMNMNQF